MKKANLGQYNTKNSVWLKPQVEQFINDSYRSCVVDPFVGAGDLLIVAKQLGITKAIGLDIDSSLGWQVNDSLIDIPHYEDSIIITNPPYLSKNSAARQDFESQKYFSDNDFVDLYQLALTRVLEKYDKAVFIIPETYFLTDLFKESLDNITILEDNPFEDTDCPVCVACFDAEPELFSVYQAAFYSIYKNDKFLFTNTELRDIIKKSLCFEKPLEMDFNQKKGNIGLRGVDGVDPQDKIRFCMPQELDYDFDKIKISSRAITLIQVSYKDKRKLVQQPLISKANEILEKIRLNTYDVVFAPFKNNNKKGIRRRRLDFGLAKKILNKAARDLTK